MKVKVNTVTSTSMRCQQLNTEVLSDSHNSSQPTALEPAPTRIAILAAQAEHAVIGEGMLQLQDDIGALEREVKAKYQLLRQRAVVLASIHARIAS